MGHPFCHEIRVRYGECDPQGILFNAHYLMYADVAYTELWRAAIGPWSLMEERGIDAVVAEANLRFRSPARFDDVVRLGCAITRLGATSIDLAIAVERGEDRLADVTMRHVIVDRSTWTKTEVPGWVRDGLEPFVRSPADLPRR